MDHSLIRAIVQVDEVLLELVRERAGINSVPVVLRRDMALTRSQIQCRDIMRTIPVLELDGPRTCRKSKQLVTEANSKDWDLGGLHQALEMVDSLGAVRRVTWTVGDEDAVEVVGHFVDWEIVREDGYGCTAGDEGAQDVLLDAAVDDCDVGVADRGADVEGCFS